MLGQRAAHGAREGQGTRGPEGTHSGRASSTNGRRGTGVRGKVSRGMTSCAQGQVAGRDGCWGELGRA
jgi:hypothetical protein